MIFFLKKAVKDISENRVLNSVAVITIALSVLIVSAFALFSINANTLLHSWKKGIRVMAYLSPGAAPAQTSEVQQKIQAISGVQEMVFISKETALQAFKKQLKGQSSLLEGLKQNPLPDSYEIRLRSDVQDEDQLKLLAGQIASISGVSDVEYGQQLMGRVSSILSLFRFVSYAMGGLFLLAAIFIVANTIRLILYSRREEVEIMRLVGATDRFIKTPFYIEGLIQGGVGAVFGLLILYGGFLWIGTNIGQDNFGSSFKMHFFSFEITCLVIISSMSIGWIGCYLSLKQFLK